jgi:hypothetical protein
MKTGLVNSSGALFTALVALSLVFGASRAVAEDLDATGCLPPTVVAENSAEVAEAFELACLSSRTGAQALDTVEVASPSAIEGQAISTEVDRSVVAAAFGNDIRLWADAAFSPAVIEGPAILIELPQSVTVASSGNDIADEATYITRSAPSIAILDRIE